MNPIEELIGFNVVLSRTYSRISSTYSGPTKGVRFTQKLMSSIQLEPIFRI